MFHLSVTQYIRFFQLFKRLISQKFHIFSCMLPKHFSNCAVLSLFCRSFFCSFSVILRNSPM